MKEGDKVTVKPNLYFRNGAEGVISKITEEEVHVQITDHFTIQFDKEHVGVYFTVNV